MTSAAAPSTAATTSPRKHPPSSPPDWPGSSPPLPVRKRHPSCTRVLSGCDDRGLSGASTSMYWGRGEAHGKRRVHQGTAIDPGSPAHGHRPEVRPRDHDSGLVRAGRRPALPAAGQRHRFRLVQERAEGADDPRWPPGVRRSPPGRSRPRIRPPSPGSSTCSGPSTAPGTWTATTRSGTPRSRSRSADPAPVPAGSAPARVSAGRVGTGPGQVPAGSVPARPVRRPPG